MIKLLSRLDLHGSRIDRENGVIKGVSLIAMGDARGHDKKVDLKTLESVRDCAKGYGDGLRVKFNPSTFQHGVGSLLGYIPPKTIRIEEGKTVGDLHLYENFPNDAKEYLYEIAEKTPGNIGLSIEFSGDDEKIGDENFARCDQIYAATVVDLPAANPTGLFAEKEPYGDVDYADPGYQADKKKRYPLDTEKHVRAALSYINQEENASKYSSEDLTKVKNKIKSAAKKLGIKVEEMIMDEETITKLTTGIAAATAKATAEALKPILQKFAEGNGNGNGDDKNKGKKKEDDDNGDQDEGGDAEELAAAGVTDGDDAATKKSKLAAYRGSLDKPVSAMSGRELIQTIKSGNMQFFRETGNRPVRTNAEPRRGASDSPFEDRVKQQMANGCKSRGLAIARARRDHPAEYNEFMAKKNPNVQHLVVKK